MAIFSIVVLLIIGVLAFYIIMIYNKLVTLRNRISNSFAQIEVQLKRRYDLIPNLIETAKGYLAHERDTLEAVINARNIAHKGLDAAHLNPSDPQAIRQLAEAEGNLMGALSRLNVVMEAYPELKASENMMQLTEELTSTENRISFARQIFNDQVMDYNTYKQSFPQNFFASSFGHNRDATMLQFEDSGQIQAAPNVKF